MQSGEHIHVCDEYLGVWVCLDQHQPAYLMDTVKCETQDTANRTNNIYFM